MPADSETAQVAFESKSLSWSGKPHIDGIDPAVERRVVRKLDVYILPIMTMFYLLSFLVRSRSCLLPNVLSLWFIRIAQTSVCLSDLSYLTEL